MDVDSDNFLSPSLSPPLLSAVFYESNIRIKKEKPLPGKGSELT